MANLATAILTPVWETSRTVSLALIAGFARKTGFHDLEERVTALPHGSQAVIVSLTLSLLLGLSLFAAQFGLIGLAAFLIGVVVIIG